MVTMFLSNRYEMRKSYRGPTIDSSYQVSVHLAKRIRGEDFYNSTNQKQELHMVAMFLMDLDEMIIFIEDLP